VTNSRYCISHVAFAELQKKEKRKREKISDLSLLKQKQTGTAVLRVIRAVPV